MATASTIIHIGRNYDLRVHWARLFFAKAADFVDEAAKAKDLPPRGRFRRLAMILRGDSDPALRERGDKVKAKAASLVDLMLDCDLGREDDHE